MGEAEGHDPLPFDRPGEKELGPKLRQWWSTGKKRWWPKAFWRKAEEHRSGGLLNKW